LQEQGQHLDEEFPKKQERGMLLPPPISANLAFTCCVIVLQASVTETVLGCDLGRYMYGVDAVKN
jgi:hypothetical protein